MIGLIDCNSFYASCERVFRPDLERKPVLVLSNNDGCAISLTDEAKALGIKMGSPAHMIDEDVIKKHGVAMFSSNYTLYGDLSKRVMDTISAFVPRIEVYSIDEAFVDLDGIKASELEKIGHAIRSTVKKNVGIPVSIGIAKTKTLAKMANRFAKKTKKNIGVHVLNSQNEINEVLKFTEIQDVWGIGRQYASMLLENNVTHAIDFAQLPVDFVQKNMTVVGLRTLKEMQGMPCIEWEFETPRKKNICTGRSFGKLMSDKKLIAEAVASYAANCALKLRKDNSCASSLSVFINTNPFRPQDKQYARSINIDLPVATNATNEIVSYALKAFNYIYATGYNFLKAGVVVSGIVPEKNVQYGMFDDVNRKRNRKLMGVMDTINNTYGRDTLITASQGFAKTWKMRQAKLSKCYTTNMNQLLIVKI